MSDHNHRTLAQDAGQGPLLTAALDYTAAGFPVFPVAPRGKAPLSKHGLRDASKDPLVIRRWWRKFTSLEHLGIALPAAVAITGHGFHLYYRWPGGILNGLRTSLTNLLPGIDVRGEGGYVVAPPSIHESGAAYQWERAGHALRRDDEDRSPSGCWISSGTARPERSALSRSASGRAGVTMSYSSEGVPYGGAG